MRRCWILHGKCTSKPLAQPNNWKQSRKMAKMVLHSRHCVVDGCNLYWFIIQTHTIHCLLDIATALGWNGTVNLAAIYHLLKLRSSAQILKKEGKWRRAKLCLQSNSSYSQKPYEVILITINNAACEMNSSITVVGCYTFFPIFYTRTYTHTHTMLHLNRLFDLSSTQLATFAILAYFSCYFISAYHSQIHRGSYKYSCVSQRWERGEILVLVLARVRASWKLETTLVSHKKTLLATNKLWMMQSNLYPFKIFPLSIDVITQ